MTHTPINAPPHAVGPEKAVLSVLFQYPEKIDECDILTPSHFHLPQHRIIFEAIRETVKSGKTVELVSFVEKLRATGLLDRVGGAGTITDIYTYQPTETHLAQHLEILNDYLIYRTAIIKGNELIESAFTLDPENAQNCARTAASALEEIATGSTSPPSLNEILGQSLDAFEKRLKAQEDQMGIQTIPLLDEKMRGLHGGRVYMPCAYPKGGKSILASQMVVECALKGIPSMFLTMEMSERDICDRMIIQASKMDAEAFTSPKTYAQRKGKDGVTMDTLGQVKKSVGDLKASPLFVIRPKNRNIATIVAAVRRQHRENGIRVAAIDYAQLIRSPGKSGVEEMEDVSHQIADLAQNLDIAIILPSQLNADGDTKNGRVFEEDAAFVMNIVQNRNKEDEHNYKKHRHIVVVADRFNGTSGEKIPLVFNPSSIRFEYGEDPTPPPEKKPEVPKKAEWARR